VCTNDLSEQTAKLACRQLGLDGGKLVESEEVGENEPSIGNVNCTGEEDSLVKCVPDNEAEECRKLEGLSIECGMPIVSGKHIMWGVRMRTMNGTYFEAKF